MKHIDAHIHIERGDYTLGRVGEFVDQALKRNLSEIWLLEHCYRFSEFVPMYDRVCAHSDYIKAWFGRKAGTLSVADYMRLVKSVRAASFPIEIKFGLEVCYFEQSEEFILAQTKNLDLDFLVGSVHFIDDFAFDHKPEHWENIDIDQAFKRFFEISISLAKSGLFNGVAHPDSVKLFNHKPSFSLLPYYENLARALAKNGMYAEMNSGCFRRCGSEIGMSADLICVMRGQGVGILTASDAHCPEDVGAGILEMEKLLEEMK